MQPHPLQLPHYMLTFQGHEASQIYLFNSAVLVVVLWLSRVLDLSCSNCKRWSTGCVVASSRSRPLTPLVGKFSKSKVGPKKKFARQRRTSISDSVGLLSPTASDFYLRQRRTSSLTASDRTTISDSVGLQCPTAS